MGLTVYKLCASPPSRAVLMTINALNIQDVEYVDVNLFEGEHMTEDYLKMNPQHTIPTIKDNDFYLWDSHAITTYLSNHYADDDSLYPTDVKTRALVDQKLHFDSGVLFPALRENVGPIFFSGQDFMVPESLNKLRTGYELMEKFLADTSPWLIGEQLTLADICCISSISSMNELLPIDELLYPNLSEWKNRCSEQDFYITSNEPGLKQFGSFLRSKLI